MSQFMFPWMQVSTPTLKHLCEDLGASRTAKRGRSDALELLNTVGMSVANVMRPLETEPNQLSIVPRAVSMVQVPSSWTTSMRRPTPVATPPKTSKARPSDRAKSLPAAAQATSPRKGTRTQRRSAASAKRAVTKRKGIPASTAVPSVRGKNTAQRPAAAPQKPTPAATMHTRSTRSARRASAPPEVVTPQKRKVLDAVVIDVDKTRISAPSARAKRQRVQAQPPALCPPRKKVFDGVEIPSTRWMATRVAAEITVLRRVQYPPRPPRPSQKKIFDGVEVDCLRRCYANRGNLGVDVYSDHVSTPGAELETDSQSVHSDDLVYMGSVDTAQPA
ncbi:hypothetical protein BDN71DRAFT_1445647 [Pleurotus eryngii]|uniref:Uncharacterized protein n=1 Tax=Pleurotus eryngii TaxID=5323 RepID=A0A9P6DHV3_PLEER|nr:hypothetical protein BDN71DRAFT_1445647 [Pleurotus eryngii]